MNRKISALLSVFLIVTSVLMGCSMTKEKNENSIYNNYYNAKVQYVGNNSEVINLLNVLGVGDLGEYTIALTTDKEPYGLTINYSKLKKDVDEDKFMAMRQINYTFYLLALVDNLSFVNVNYKTYNYSLDIDTANKTVNGNIKKYGSSQEKLKELNDKLNPQN